MPRVLWNHPSKVQGGCSEEPLELIREVMGWGGGWVGEIWTEAEEHPWCENKITKWQFVVWQQGRAVLTVPYFL